MFQRTALRPIAIPFHSIGFTLALRCVRSAGYFKDLNGTTGFKLSHMAVGGLTLPAAICRGDGIGIHASSPAVFETGNSFANVNLHSDNSYSIKRQNISNEINDFIVNTSVNDKQGSRFVSKKFLCIIVCCGL
jgi:hypothetical protein